MSESKNNKPTHIIKHVVGEGKTARWTNIGVAWSIMNNEGLSIALNFIPTSADGKLLAVPFKDEKAVSSPSSE